MKRFLNRPIRFDFIRRLAFWILPAALTTSCYPTYWGGLDQAELRSQHREVTLYEIRHKFRSNEGLLMRVTDATGNTIAQKFLKCPDLPDDGKGTAAEASIESFTSSELRIRYVTRSGTRHYAWPWSAERNIKGS